MYLYEKAITKELNELLTSKVSTVIADTLDEGLRRSAAKNGDKTVLPLIIITGGDWQILDANFYAYMHGIENKITQGIQKSTEVIPIQPTYTMYIATASSQECDMLTREIIFHFYQNPTLSVDIPYNINKSFTFNIVFNNLVRKTQKQTGLVYRSIDFILQGAYLFHNASFNFLKEITTNVKEHYDDIDEEPKV